jgi:hypothetical protein
MRPDPVVTDYVTEENASARILFVMSANAPSHPSALRLEAPPKDIVRDINEAPKRTCIRRNCDGTWSTARSSHRDVRLERK